MMSLRVFYEKEGLAGPSQSSLQCKSNKYCSPAQVFLVFLLLRAQIFLCSFLLSSRVNNLVEGIRFLLNAFACK